MGTKSLVLHADGIVEDVRRHDRAKELEVGKVEAVAKLKVSQLRPLHTGPGHIKDRLLLWIMHGVEESQVRVTVLRRVAVRDGLKGVLNKHGGFTANTRGFRR